MKVFIRRHLNCILACHVLVLILMLCFLFGWVDFRSQESVGVRLARSGHDFRSHAPLRRLAPVSKCQENVNLPGLAQTIPADHQLFLRYKHCRSFPTLLAPRACDHDLYLLLAIKSTTAQIDRRAALRNTWGQAGTIRGKKVRLVFLMGRSQGNVKGYPLQSLLEYESWRFGDILQWDFADSFLNLTLKEVHFLSWFRQECRETQFVLKGEDDVFVHTGNVLEFLQDKDPSDHLFVADVIFNAGPCRNRSLKDFIPAVMFLGYQYPPYAGGGGYLMSRRTAISLYHAARDMDLFPIDNVFVGMCLQKMNVSLIFHSGFRTFGIRQKITPFDPCVYRELMVVHELTSSELWAMWSMVNDPNLTCRKSIKL